MNPRWILKYFQPVDFVESDTGKTDGTVYFTLDASSEPELRAWLDQFFIQVRDTPGAAGTNTYTVEITIDGTNWYDYTNAWYGAATFTTHFCKCATFPTPISGIRVKRVRTSDGGNNDGGSAVTIRQRRFST